MNHYIQKTSKKGHSVPAWRTVAYATYPNGTKTYLADYHTFELDPNSALRMINKVAGEFVLDIRERVMGEAKLLFDVLEDSGEVATLNEGKYIQLARGSAKTSTNTLATFRLDVQRVTAEPQFRVYYPELDGVL